MFRPAADTLSGSTVAVRTRRWPPPAAAALTWNRSIDLKKKNFTGHLLNACRGYRQSKRDKTKRLKKNIFLQEVRIARLSRTTETPTERYSFVFLVVGGIWKLKRVVITIIILRINCSNVTTNNVLFWCKLFFLLQCVHFSSIIIQCLRTIFGWTIITIVCRLTVQGCLHWLKKLLKNVFSMTIHRRRGHLYEK